jgi:hypothetical protein
METTNEDKHYLKGFDDGCEYILMEIERFGKQHNIFVSDILHHLRNGNGKDNTVHNKEGNTNWDLL